MLSLEKRLNEDLDESKESINQKGLDLLVKESFHFEKTKEPVDAAIIYFVDQNCNYRPEKLISNAKENLNNIDSTFKKDYQNDYKINKYKIDSYFLSNDNNLYTKENHEYVDFITTAIIEASIKSHKTKNLIYYVKNGDLDKKKYFFGLLAQKINDPAHNQIKEYFNRLETFYPMVEPETKHIDAIVFSCIDPNLLEDNLEKIKLSYNLKNYLSRSIPGGGLVFKKSKIIQSVIDSIKQTPGYDQDTKIIIDSHGSNQKDNKDCCYNCGGYELFENLIGNEAYEQACEDLKLAKEILKNNGISNVDIVINTTKFISESDGSKLYKAGFEKID